MNDLLREWFGKTMVFTMLMTILFSAGAVYAADKTIGYADKSSNRTFVPIRFLSGQLGASADWDPKKKEIHIRRQHADIRIYVGQAAGYVNGNQVMLDDSPFTENGRAYVPLRFAADTFGMVTEWESATTTVILTAEGKSIKVPVIDRGIHPDKLPAFRQLNKKFKVSGRSLEAHMLIVNLLHPKVDLDIGLAGGKIGAVEDLKSLAIRSKAAAAINGTFFDAYTDSNLKTPYGYVVSGGELKKKASGDHRTIVIFDRNNNAELISGDDFTARFAEGDLDGALQAGPRLVVDGRIDLDLVKEGFKDPKILTSGGARSALGLTRNHTMILLIVSGATIPQLAELMVQAGAYQAMNLDGGSSSGLYYNGNYITRPGREISNALLIYG